ncbi:hypothetical protein PHSY_004838 [Pseudozyma hubeiensis SY62]|uniref:Uncharacterized protein n=1 Tax=Pseudozyma hubeiensis (strain SY62) TaxID=1305764 RepID=R9P783_PSEHS|nr:hypothetical protein PHSY_004838 [Pseudozyma hubeiensis SY62]GAC97253.1 hypothetical protein PHSY_004838 [Pseudozyma hubeiensis SY62]
MTLTSNRVTLPAIITPLVTVDMILAALGDFCASCEYDSSDQASDQESATADRASRRGPLSAQETATPTREEGQPSVAFLTDAGGDWDGDACKLRRNPFLVDAGDTVSEMFIKNVATGRR